MTCPRCHGLMVSEWLTDFLSIAPSVDGWRCLNCGRVEDAVIIHHQRQSSIHKKTSVRSPGTKEIAMNPEI
jgi:RNA polymerase subunit RPABC4/transcription elongation factor Spt4